jgi:hypothetical protein
MYNIFSYILFNVFNWRYQTYSKKEIQNLFYSLRDCLVFKRGELRAYKIKPVLFLFALGLLAATKTLFKRNEKDILTKKHYTKVNL